MSSHRRRSGDSDRRSQSPSPRRHCRDHERERDEGKPHREKRTSHDERDRTERHKTDYVPREHDRERYGQRNREDERRFRKSRRDTPSDDEDLLDLKRLGVRPITEDDYSARSGEFRYWLRETRDKYLDEMASEQGRKYFRRFVRRWNDGALRERYYGVLEGASEAPSSSIKLASAKSVTATLLANRSPSPLPGPSLSPARPDPQYGATFASESDKQLALEAAHDVHRASRKAELNKAYTRADEAAPRSGGREGKMEERRATNAVNREMRDKEVGGLEVDEGTLMGDGGGFRAAIRARDAANAKRNNKRAEVMASRRAADEVRLQDRRTKDSSTMDMFKALAKERFG